MTQHRATDAPEASPEEPLTDAPEASATESEAADSPVPVDVAALQRERDDYYDRFMRKAAEFDNYRKRVERERREQGDQAVVELLRDLLAVVDDFDIALAIEGEHEWTSELPVDLAEFVRGAHAPRVHGAAPSPKRR